MLKSRISFKIKNNFYISPLNLLLLLLFTVVLEVLAMLDKQRREKIIRNEKKEAKLFYSLIIKLNT